MQTRRGFLGTVAAGMAAVKAVVAQDEANARYEDVKHLVTGAEHTSVSEEEWKARVARSQGHGEIVTVTCPDKCLIYVCGDSRDPKNWKVWRA